jgi:hypothetical protein
MKSWLPLVVAADIEAIVCERLPQTQGHAIPGLWLCRRAAHVVPLFVSAPKVAEEN